jgi:hypothetical protein
VKITIWPVGHIIIYDNVDTFNVDSSAENVGRNTDSLVEVFEGLVSCDTKVRSWYRDGRTVLLEEVRRGW